MAESDAPHADSPLEEAAEEGPLPGIAQEDAVEERGDDDSQSPDEEALDSNKLGNFVKRLDNE